MERNEKKLEKNVKSLKEKNYEILMINTEQCNCCENKLSSRRAELQEAKIMAQTKL